MRGEEGRGGGVRGEERGEGVRGGRGGGGRVEKGKGEEESRRRGEKDGHQRCIRACTYMYVCTHTSVTSPLAREAILKSASSSPVRGFLAGGASASKSRSELEGKKGWEEGFTRVRSILRWVPVKLYWYSYYFMVFLDLIWH